MRSGLRRPDRPAFSFLRDGGGRRSGLFFSHPAPLTLPQGFPYASDVHLSCPAGREERRFAVGRDPRAPATIVFTSGSTRKSKGSMLSQEALLQYTEDSVVYDRHLPDDVAIVTLPTHHALALCLLVTAFVARYALFFPRTMRADYVLKCMERYRIRGTRGNLSALQRARRSQRD